MFFWKGGLKQNFHRSMTPAKRKPFLKVKEDHPGKGGAVAIILTLGKGGPCTLDSG